MARHEKHDRAAVHQDRDLPTNKADGEPLDDLEGVEELVKTSFAAGNEMKIAAAVIGILVLVFAAVVVQWLRRSSAPAPTPSEETVATHDRPASPSRDKEKEKEEPDRRDASPFGPSAKSAKPTVVAAVPGTGSELKPKFGVKGPDTWSFPSDTKPKGTGPDDRPPPSSFQPRMASRDAKVPDSRPKALDEPKPSLGGWQQDSDFQPRSVGSPPEDPFRNRPAREARGLENSPSPSGSPLSSNASTPGGLRPPPSTDGGRWGQGLSSSAAPASPGRAEEPKWVLPQGEVSSPSSSSPTRGPWAAPAATPLRSPNPGGSAASTPSPGPPMPPSAQGPSALASSNTGSNPTNSGFASGSGGLRTQGKRTYIVQHGDTLYDIARRQLGKASRWREIYDLNKDLINTRWLDLEPGTQLLLPDVSPESLTERPGVGSLR